MKNRRRFFFRLGAIVLLAVFAAVNVIRNREKS